jgi:hypothetical protein
MVVHYRNVQGELCHTSVVGIADVKQHSAGTTLAFICKLIPEVCKILPELKIVHYVTDSPASQYRNKAVIKIVAQHEKWLNGVTCTWEYLESGHGKGPADGVGGSVKHSAEIAVKKGEVIACAKDMYEWAQKSGGVITYVYVNGSDVNLAEKKISNAQYVKGISLAHSLRPANGFVHMRVTSCFNVCCREFLNCPGWQKTSVKVYSPENSTENIADPPPEVETNEPEGVDVPEVAGSSVNDVQDDEDAPEVVTKKQMYTPGMMVKAYYNKKLYVGRVLEYESDEDDYYISFMQKKRKTSKYLWPERKDVIWVQSENIVREVFLNENNELEDPK